MMKTTVTNGVVLQPVETTSLYEPAQPAPGEKLLFLLWDAGTRKQPIPLEDTWATAGAPPRVGYFLFLNVRPAAGAFAGFEQNLRKLLPDPVTSGFVWVIYDPKTKSAATQTLLKTKLNDSNQPCVDGDTELVLLPGQDRVGFSDGAPVFAADSSGFITAFVTTYPALDKAQTPQHAGVVLPMMGGLVGCVSFAGLVNSPGSRKASDSARKTLVEVAIDPLHPLDVKRNFERFSGQNFILTQKGDSYSISRA
jgi:hypothetical protein